MTGSAVFIGLREECEVAGPTAEGVALGNAGVGVCPEDRFVGTKVKADSITAMLMGRDKAPSCGTRGFADTREEVDFSGMDTRIRIGSPGLARTGAASPAAPTALDYQWPLNAHRVFGAGRKRNRCAFAGKAYFPRFLPSPSC